MIVNTRGARFCNEEVYGAKLGYEMCESHGGKAWLVIDSTIRRDAVREALSGRLWGFQSVPALVLTYLGAKRAGSIEDLARRIGADVTSMRQSWQSYNDAAHSGDDPLGKSRDLLHPLEAPPFYALDISVDKRVFPCAALTLGGLCVDETDGAVRTARRHRARTLCRRTRRRRHRLESLRERTGARGLHLVGQARRPFRRRIQNTKRIES